MEPKPHKNMLCTCRLILDSHLKMWAEVGFTLGEDGSVNIVDVRVAGNIYDIANLKVLSKESIKYRVKQLIQFGEYCKGAIK